MIAYNHRSLENLLIREEVNKAFYKELLTKEEVHAIQEAYPVDLYMPNLFIRIGLFLLTVVIVLMGFGLFCLISGITFEKGIGVLAFIFSAATYISLEYLIHNRKHFRSGIDDALLWLSMAFLIIGLNLILSSISSLQQSLLVFALALYCVLRFANAIMAAISFISLLTAVFYSMISLGALAKSILPFVIMGIAFFTYWSIKLNKEKKWLRYYSVCCVSIETLALIAIYAAGNYFVVRELSNEIFDLHLKEGESIPGGWVFWVITVLLPLVYLVRGVLKKDILLMRTGLFLMGAMICTIRYYHSIAPLEIMISIGGALLILIAYCVTKYLTPPKHGFTHKEPNDPQLSQWLQLESISIAQTFPPGSTPADAGNSTHFGGGSGGGGGATGQY